MGGNEKIRLTKEQRTDMTSSIKKYFREQKGEEIGDLGAGILLDFIIERLAPEFYNQGIAGFREIHGRPDRGHDVDPDHSATVIQEAGRPFGPIIVYPGPHPTMDAAFAMSVLFLIFDLGHLLSFQYLPFSIHEQAGFSVLQHHIRVVDLRLRHP